MNIERILTGMAALLVFVIAGAYATGLQHTLPMFASQTDNHANSADVEIAPGIDGVVERGRDLSPHNAAPPNTRQDLAAYQMTLPHYAAGTERFCPAAVGNIADRQALAEYQAGLTLHGDTSYAGAREQAACGSE